jgi:hypothetical protein
MNQRTCPYLGSKEDPNTALDFPSQGNSCYHARPVATIRRSHQNEFCLSEKHSACPVFLASKRGPLPHTIAAPKTGQVSLRRIMALAAIPIMVILTALTVSWLDNIDLSNWLGQSTVLSSESKPAAESLPISLFGNPRSPTRTPFPANTTTSTPSVEALAATCSYPSNWGEYVVKPTDSLFRLSVLYGISLKSLHDSNCLGERSIVLPGDIIYVPILPTKTPTASFTPSQPANDRIIQIPATAVPQSGQSSGNNNQPNPPAAVVDTQAPPPSPVPPTLTVPTTEPTAIQPTEEIPTLAPPPVEPTTPPPPPTPENTPTVAPAVASLLYRQHCSLLRQKYQHCHRPGKIPFSPRRR